jgi:hypothetical protein
MTPFIEPIVGIALIYAAGFGSGWHWARRSTRYMLGGRL